MVRKRNDEERFQEEVTAELEQTRRELLDEENLAAKGRGGDAHSWEVASDLVDEFRPVPWFMWTIIRSVFGRKADAEEANPMLMFALAPIVKRAVGDLSFGDALRSKEELDKMPLSEAVELVGIDVASALCYMHAVCRRVSTALSERIWRPLLDDALLRAQIGYNIGSYCETLGRGRGMLAGFSGRCGLAIQIAAGDILQAQQTLETLASGVDIREVGLKIYGCDPLQVSAMSLSAGGCTRDAAIGIASYSTAGKNVMRNSEQYRWLSAFSIAENLRMGSLDQIKPSYWEELGFEDLAITALKKKTQKLQRRGHSWAWITERLLGGDEDESVALRPPRRFKTRKKTK